MAFYLLVPTSRLRKAAITQMLRAGRDAQQHAAWSFISTTVAFVTNPSLKRLASRSVLQTHLPWHWGTSPAKLDTTKTDLRYGPSHPKLRTINTFSQLFPTRTRGKR